MKSLLTALFLLAIMHCSFAQSEEGLGTDEFKISGLIDSAKTISYKDLLAHKLISIPDITIKNHEGKVRRAYKKVYGIPLMDILNTVHITSSSPKLLSEYYFIFKGSDGYAVVYSWNELFNSSAGANTYIIMEADDKKIDHTNGGILVLSTSDVNTGRRHLKGLSSIEIKKM